MGSSPDAAQPNWPVTSRPRWRTFARRAEIDAHGIGLLGHADGGRTAAMAAERNPDVSFLAVLSMASVPASEAFAERNLLNAEASGGSYAGGGRAGSRRTAKWQPW